MEINGERFFINDVYLNNVLNESLGFFGKGVKEYEKDAFKIKSSFFEKFS